MVRRSNAAASYRETSDEESEYSDSYVTTPKISKKSSSSNGKRKSKGGKGGPRGKISPSKTPASRRSEVYSDNDSDYDDDDDGYAPAPKKTKYRSEEESDVDSEDDYGSRKKKKASPKKKSGGRGSPKKKAGKKSKGGGKKKRSKYAPTTSDEGEDDEDNLIEYPVHKKKVSHKSSARKEKLPPVSEMVVESIKALRDNPKLGSTLGAIKETIGLNWDLDLKSYDSKIKRYISNAVTMGELIQTKGNGFRGRWTVPGLKAKKKAKKAKKLGKKFDEDEVEYEAKATKRDEDRVRAMMDLERRRDERAVWQEKVAAEKALEPKKVRPKKPVQDNWEVVAIKGHKVVGGKDWFLIKYEGPSKPQWEPEENVEGCMELVESFLDEKERQKEELAQMRKDAEENGVFEVSRILKVNFLKDDKKEFLIRWKGWGPSGDTWEDEENLDCDDIIKDFMDKYERNTVSFEKSLRVAPKQVERLAESREFSDVKRKVKHKTRYGKFVSYTDMD